MSHKAKSQLYENLISLLNWASMNKVTIQCNPEEYVVSMANQPSQRGNTIAEALSRLRFSKSKSDEMLKELGYK